MSQAVPDAPAKSEPATDPLPSAALAHVLGQSMGILTELERLRATVPFVDGQVEEIVGRRIRVGDHWLIDFASCNYLGFDLDREIIESVPEYLDRWGTHPSWSRMIASPRLLPEIEETLADLLGVADTLLLPTITHIHISVLPALVGTGSLFIEVHGHQSMQEGALAAQAHGAAVGRFREDRLDRLERRLRTARHPRLICVDGINSMTGNGPPLAELADLARRHEALLYVDDAHGFGVIGERSPDEPSPYGLRGNGIVRHLGESYDSLVLVGGFSKAYSSLLAFVAVPTPLKNFLKTMSGPYTFSGPPPVASLATALTGLRVNAERGETFRTRLYELTAQVLDGVRDLGLRTLNTSGFPIIELPLTDPTCVDSLGRFLYDHGVYITAAPFPVVPRDQVGARIQVTAANTAEEVDELLAVLGKAADRFPLARVADVPVN